MKTLSAIFLLLGLTLLSQASLAAEACSLKTGWEPWKPYQYESASGNATGLDVELVSAVIEGIDCKVHWKEMPWARLIAETKKGSVDLTSGASYTNERSEWAYFSEPYRQESLSLFVLSDPAKKYDLNKVEDLFSAGFTVGLVRGTAYGEKIDALLKQDQYKKHVNFVTSEDQNFQKLLGNRINGYIADTISGISQLRDKGLLDKIEVHPLKVYATDIHVMFSKHSTSPELVQKFNESIAKLKSNGKYDEILNRYLAK